MFVRPNLGILIGHLFIRFACSPFFAKLTFVYDDDRRLQPNNPIPFLSNNFFWDSLLESVFFSVYSRERIRQKIFASRVHRALSVPRCLFYDSIFCVLVFSVLSMFYVLLYIFFSSHSFAPSSPCDSASFVTGCCCCWLFFVVVSVSISVTICLFLDRVF